MIIVIEIRCGCCFAELWSTLVYIPADKLVLMRVIDAVKETIADVSSVSPSL